VTSRKPPPESENLFTSTEAEEHDHSADVPEAGTEHEKVVAELKQILLSTVVTERDGTTNPVLHAIVDFVDMNDDPQIQARGEDQCDEVVDNIYQHSQSADPLLPLGSLSDLRLQFDHHNSKRDQDDSRDDDTDVQRNQNCPDKIPSVSRKARSVNGPDLSTSGSDNPRY